MVITVQVYLPPQNQNVIGGTQTSGWLFPNKRFVKSHWLQFPTLVLKDGNGKKLKNSSESYKPHLVMGLLLLKEDIFGPVPQRSRMLAILLG